MEEEEEEEIDVLKAIYAYCLLDDDADEKDNDGDADTDDDVFLALRNKDKKKETTTTTTITVHFRHGAATLVIHLPRSYPSSSMPVYELTSRTKGGISPDQRSAIQRELEQIWHTHAGHPVCYQWIEAVRAHLADLPVSSSSSSSPSSSSSVAASTTAKVAEETVAAMAAGAEEEEKETRKSGTVNALEMMMHRQKELKGVEQAIVHGPTTEDRRSVFQAHVYPVHCAQDVKDFLAALKSDRKIARATHNILAYRYRDERTSHVAQDCDDDGENMAGGRLLHLLNIVDACNVAVVVTRWFGGIMLGPDRFKHISNAARNILQSCGYIHRAEHSKKHKT